MKTKTTAIIFALIMALQFIVNAQTTAGDSKVKATSKPTVEKVQTADKAGTPIKAESDKSDASATGAGCCKGKTDAACTGKKEGSKDCKGAAKSGEGCKGHGDTKSSGCQGHPGTTGDAKSSSMQNNSTGATGIAGENRSTKGCCHK